jgi:zinc transport system ATP-binding protein
MIAETPAAATWSDPASDAPEILVMRDLTVGYDSRPVLTHVNFQARTGDFISLVGPNGGGKTTLCRAILGLIPIQSGTIALFGGDVRAGRQQVGYVPQRSDLDPRFPLRVREVVAMGCLGPGMRRTLNRQAEERLVAESLATVGMEAHAGDPIRELSGGQLQRVFIARALATRPRMLILDEPVTHLDPEITAGFYKMLQDMGRDHTILMCTHDLEAARACGGRMLRIDGGLTEIGASGGRSVVSVS